MRIGYKLHNSNTRVCVYRGPRVGIAIPMRKSHVSYGYESEARLKQNTCECHGVADHVLMRGGQKNCMCEVESS